MRKLIATKNKNKTPPAVQKGTDQNQCSKITGKQEELSWECTTPDSWGTTRVSIPRCEEQSGAAREPFWRGIFKTDILYNKVAGLGNHPHPLPGTTKALHPLTPGPSVAKHVITITANILF